MNARVFDRVWSEVRGDYYDPTIHGLDWAAVRTEYRPEALAASDDAGLYGVVDRMLALLDDAHANAFTPVVARRQDLLRRRHAILGLTLFPEVGGGFRIERVRPGSPAADAGVQRGWRLGPSAEGWTPDHLVVAGEAVPLTFIDTDGDAHPVTIVARTMEPLPAFSADRSHAGVVVLRAEGFEAGLGRWLGDQLRDLAPETAVVLDLRSNPGGLLREADATLACFLPQDHPWARRTSRSGSVEVLSIVSRCGSLRAPVTNRLAVLVDASSRSAAELTPAALQEAGRAVVVGHRTAGAVLISRETDLPGGGRLSLSRADFVTIDGVRLEKHGVIPDIAVDDAAPPDLPSQPDPALDAALDALAQSAQSPAAGSIRSQAFP
ncbi:S41 family peptidase [soil metagenome]